MRPQMSIARSWAPACSPAPTRKSSPATCIMICGPGTHRPRPASQLGSQRVCTSPGHRETGSQSVEQHRPLWNGRWEVRSAAVHTADLPTPATAASCPSSSAQAHTSAEATLAACAWHAVSRDHAGWQRTHACAAGGQPRPLNMQAPCGQVLERRSPPAPRTRPPTGTSRLRTAAANRQAVRQERCRSRSSGVQAGRHGPGGGWMEGRSTPGQGRRLSTLLLPHQRAWSPMAACWLLAAWLPDCLTGCTCSAQADALPAPTCSASTHAPAHACPSFCPCLCPRACSLWSL